MVKSQDEPIFVAGNSLVDALATVEAAIAARSASEREPELGEVAA
jgi:hypothetical protein